MPVPSFPERTRRAGAPLPGSQAIAKCSPPITWPPTSQLPCLLSVSSLWMPRAQSVLQVHCPQEVSGCSSDGYEQGPDPLCLLRWQWRQVAAVTHCLGQWDSELSWDVGRIWIFLFTAQWKALNFEWGAGEWGSQKVVLSHSRGLVFGSGLGQNAPMMELSFRVPWTPPGLLLVSVNFCYITNHPKLRALRE